VSEICANCGAELNGAYCATCGQKRFVDADRRLGHLLQQFVEAATDLDGRFWGSVGALLLQPGRLSRDFIAGRRARWMSPIAVFLLVNVVYFVFAPESDFATPFEREVPGRIAVLARDPGTLDEPAAARLRARPGPLHSRFTAPLVERRVQARDTAARVASDGRSGYDYRNYRRAYERMVPEISKALAIVHVPALAAVLMLLLRHTRRYYAEHFVVALHLLAFELAAILILVHGMSLVHVLVPPADWHNALLNWTVRCVLTVYVVIALRHVYAIAWHWSIAVTAALFLAYVLINFYLYRPVLFLTVFALT
jgi:Protein of unknown function (DUF3667)